MIVNKTETTERVQDFWLEISENSLYLIMEIKLSWADRRWILTIELIFTTIELTAYVSESKT